MTGTLDRIYKSIPIALSLQCCRKLGEWRDRATTGLDKVGRRVVTEVALLPLGILSIVETTMSLALAILTAPAEIAGLHLSSLFLERANQGAISVSFSFILYPISNIFRKKLDSIDEDDIKTPFLNHAVLALWGWRFDKRMERAALLVLGVLGSVEAIISLALGILTAPVSIVGFSAFPRSFFSRAYKTVLVSLLAFSQLVDLNLRLPDAANYKGLQRVYRVIETPLSRCASEPLKKWRNQGAPGVDKTVRTIMRGVALGALEITSLIESIASFALGLLTAPAEIVGIRFSTRFLERSHVLLRFRSLVD